LSNHIKGSIDFFKQVKKKRGEVFKWSNKLLLYVRDKMRRVGRANRDKWTLDFYEKLQGINKESQRRKLTQHTP